jgi:dTDP-4-dehydrorhamnose 3,5-epimerase
MTAARFTCHATPLSGLVVIERKPIVDDRGFFCRYYCSEEFHEAGLRKPIVQINHTLTRKKGSIRGLHFQYPPHLEAKIVGCLKGEIFDVAVDLRKGSPTFLRWHGEKLSESNRNSLLVPEGFAHGFQALAGECELIYLHTASYAPEAEGGLNVLDPRLSIDWPLGITELSDRDRMHPMLAVDFDGIAS